MRNQHNKRIFCSAKSKLPYGRLTKPTNKYNLYLFLVHGILDATHSYISAFTTIDLYLGRLCDTVRFRRMLNEQFVSGTIVDLPWPHTIEKWGTNCCVKTQNCSCNWLICSFSATLLWKWVDTFQTLKEETYTEWQFWPNDFQNFKHLRSIDDWMAILWVEFELREFSFKYKTRIRCNFICVLNAIFHFTT